METLGTPAFSAAALARNTAGVQEPQAPTDEMTASTDEPCRDLDLLIEITPDVVFRPAAARDHCGDRGSEHKQRKRVPVLVSAKAAVPHFIAEHFRNDFHVTVRGRASGVNGRAHADDTLHCHDVVACCESLICGKGLPAELGHCRLVFRQHDVEIAGDAPLVGTGRQNARAGNVADVETQKTADA